MEVRIVYRHFLALVSVALVACSGPSVATPGATTAGTAVPGSPTPPAATVNPAPTTAVAATVDPAATPTVFTSPLYGYSVTLPAGWAAGAAILRWDGTAQSGHEEPEVDKFAGPPSASPWAFAGPVSLDLDGFVKDRIAANFRDHGDTCPAEPEVNEPIQIGGKAGRFLAWNCGILINQAVTVRGGVGFSFLMRDFNVKAATDPADSVLFQGILDSVVYPS
jgi:hypothetical protein